MTTATDTPAPAKRKPRGRPPKAETPKPPPNLNGMSQAIAQHYTNIQMAQRAYDVAGKGVTDSQKRIDALTAQLTAAQTDRAAAQEAQVEAQAKLRDAMAALGATAADYGSAL